MKSITITHKDLYEACEAAIEWHGIEPIIKFKYEKVLEVENKAYDLVVDVIIKYDDEENRFYEIGFSNIVIFEDGEEMNLNLSTGINYESHEENIREAEKYCIWRLNELIGVNDDVLY